MKIEQIYTGCLAHGAYYITDSGEAAIIDPLRETTPYLERLKQDNCKLKYIFETHFHADFVSGHIDLSRKTGAPIVYGPNAMCDFDCIAATDKQVFELGNIKIKVLHTPGHTLESTCFLLIDETGKDIALFSGDTLFLGDVGRPDLAQQAANMTKEQLAGLLYEGIYNKILHLPDTVIIYPGHGAGSACGKNMMKETVDNLGNQKQINYALQQPNKEAFVKAVTAGLLPPPGYFEMNVEMNKRGYASFDTVMNNGMKALSADKFHIIAEEQNALILDTRNGRDFAKGFIPQSVNIGLEGDFAPWAGTLIVNVMQPILLVTENGTEQEAITRLSRVGFDNVLGHLKQGFHEWKIAGKPIDIVERISAEKFAKEFVMGHSIVIDIRKESEYAAGHVKGATNKPLAYINKWIAEINTRQHFYLYCASGYRSMIAASILQAKGLRNFTEIKGGFSAIAETGVPIQKRAELITG